MSARQARTRTNPISLRQDHGKTFSPDIETATVVRGRGTSSVSSYADRKFVPKQGIPRLRLVSADLKAWPSRANGAGRPSMDVFQTLRVFRRVRHMREECCTAVKRSALAGVKLGQSPSTARYDAPILIHQIRHGGFCHCSPSSWRRSRCCSCSSAPADRHSRNRSRSRHHSRSRRYEMKSR